MTDERPLFKVRFLDDGSGYVIDAVWPDGAVEEIPGLYSHTRFAQHWVMEHSEKWIEDRLKQ